MLSGAILILFSRGFIKKFICDWKENVRVWKEYLAGVTDQINGIKDIKTNALEESRMKWYRNVTQRMEDEQVEYIKDKNKISIVL